MAKTVTVRIAVAVNASGEYMAGAISPVEDSPRDELIACTMGSYPSGECAYYWITAEVPLPTAPAEVRGEVVSGG